MLVWLRQSHRWILWIVRVLRGDRGGCWSQLEICIEFGEWRGMGKMLTIMDRFQTHSIARDQYRRGGTYVRKARLGRPRRL